VPDAKQIQLERRELFKQNEKWQQVLDTLLTAWTQYFNFATSYRDPGNWVEKLDVEGEGLAVRWHRTWGKDAIHDDELRIVTTWLEIFSMCQRRWFGLGKAIEIKVLCLHHQVTIPKDDIPRHCWREKRDLWEVYSANFNYLVDIVHAIGLLKRRSVDAAEDSKTHQEQLEIFSDFLDGLADVLE